ncbi:MAG: DUF1320 domain-containing protein [Nitrospinota bacterium]|nr:DUF1320 domain-containing protein [Nitrospinota bacterium]
MAYITRTDMETRYGADEILSLADRDGDGAADTGVIEAALEDATAVIDSHLVGRYTLPLNPVPAVIVRLACAMARFHLYDEAPTQKVTEEYQAAVSALQKIASGDLLLVQADGADRNPDYLEGKKQFNDIGEY